MKWLMFAVLIVAITPLRSVWANPEDAGNKEKELQEIVIEDRPTAFARWCGDTTIVYQVFTGKMDDLAHNIYNEVYWKNIDTGKGGLISRDGFVYSCSPDGKWLIYRVGSRLAPVEAKNSELKLVELPTGNEATISVADATNIPTMRQWAENGNHVFIRSFDAERRSYKPTIGSNLVIHYLPGSYRPYTWLSNGSLILVRKKGGGGFQIFDIEADKEACRDIQIPGYEDKTINLYALEYYRDYMYFPVEGDRGYSNILRCKIRNKSIACEELFKDPVSWAGEFAVLQDGDILFRGSLDGELGTAGIDKRLLRFSESDSTLRYVDESSSPRLYHLVLDGVLSPSREWVVHSGGQGLKLVNFKNAGISTEEAK